MWGTLVGFGPASLLSAAASYADKAPNDFPFDDQTLVVARVR